MSIGLIAWGRFFNARGERITVPAPSSKPAKPWLWDFLHTNAAEFGATFDVIQLPPWSLAQGGAGEGCDGYGIFQRRNLNGTRYGPLESLLAAIAALRSHGCEVWGDLVLHQLIGENGGPGVFRYAGADGHTMNGRGQTNPGWFRGNTNNNDPVPPFCPQDDVPDRGSDTPFGREVCYQRCHPPGVTEADARDYLQWVTARTGATGYRFDDVKGTYAPSVRRIMDSLPQTFFHAEYFDGNPAALNQWATSPPMNSRSAVADFTLHFRLQAACNNYDATLLDRGGAGYWQWNSGLAVGFVDTPDTDTSAGQQVVSNKALAYAYMLTLPLRSALIYGKDYFPSSVWPGAYGLKPILDNLCWISRTFAFGNYEVRWVDRDVYAASRDGNGGEVGQSGGLLTAINFNTASSRTITCSTSFGPNRHLHDYSGHHDDVWTDGNGNARFTIPANTNSAGLSFCCFAPAGVDHPVAHRSLSTTQTFFGAADLDVMPAGNAPRKLPQRILTKKGSKIALGLKAKLPANASLTATIAGPDGAVVSTQRIGSGPAHKTGRSTSAGWHTITVEGSSLPAAGTNFELSVTYQG